MRGDRTLEAPNVADHYRLAAAADTLAEDARGRARRAHLSWLDYRRRLEEEEGDGGYRRYVQCVLVNLAAARERLLKEAEEAEARADALWLEASHANTRAALVLAR